MSTDDIARLNAETLDQYFASGVSTTHVLSDEPRCELIIDPVAEQYELATPLIGTLPESIGLQRVDVDTVAYEDGTWARLRVDARDMHHEGYGLIVSVVQAMRGGAGFAAATAAALTNLKAILAARRRLSHDQQIGLLGELMVVHRLLDDHDEQHVLDRWLGPEAEQHDFGFDEGDVEVKTTTSERRSHVIHGTGQLQPNPHRPLWLLSIQVTRSGGHDGTSLTGLVDTIVDRLDAQRARFLLHLNDLGWRDTDRDLYRDRYLLRSAPLAYLVDADFPAITDDRLKATVPRTDLVSAVSYRVDVTSMTPARTSTAVDAFLGDARSATEPEATE